MKYQSKLLCHLALLKVSAYGSKPLMLGNSDAVKIGETVYVAGNPQGLEGTLFKPYRGDSGLKFLMEKKVRFVKSIESKN